MSNKPKGTARTEVIIGTAATKLSAAVKSILDATNTAKELETQLNDYNLKVTDLEGKISNLETEYSQKKAEKEFQLNLDYKTAQKKFAENFLTENGMIAVVVEEDKTLRDAYNTLKRDFEQKVAAEVAKAQGIAESRAKNEKALADAEYRAKEANNLAKIEQLQSQLTFANEQTALWKGALDAERQAGVQRAQASAIGSVNVTGTGK